MIAPKMIGVALAIAFTGLRLSLGLRHSRRSARRFASVPIPITSRFRIEPARDSRTRSRKPWQRRSVNLWNTPGPNTRGTGGFGEFLGRTLDAKTCDAVMGIPYGNREELTTQPYYVSSYVFVFKKSRNYDIKSMDSPVLRKLKIGLEGETPVEDGVKIRGMLDRTTIFDVGSTSGLSPATMLDALEKGQIDVLMTWEPAIGFFLNRYRRSGSRGRAKHPDAGFSGAVCVPDVHGGSPWATRH